MKRLVALAVSLLLLALIWWQVDVAAVSAAAASADPLWLTLGLLMVVPLTLLTAWRFRMLSRVGLPLGSATRLILSASTLNLFLPSKMGDIAKSVVLTRRYGFDPKLSVALVVFEKMMDMASLLFWGVLALLYVGGRDPLFLLAAAAVAGLFGLLLILMAPAASGLVGRVTGLLPGKLGKLGAAFGGEWQEVIRWFWSERGRAGGTVALSFLIWGLHLVQFWLFARGLAAVPLIDNIAFATLAILAGLVPLTMAGVGTRDAAIVLLYQPYLTAGQGAVLGVLATFRYILPAIGGLPFVKDFWEKRDGAAAPK